MLHRSFLDLEILLAQEIISVRLGICIPTLIIQLQANYLLQSHRITTKLFSLMKGIFTNSPCYIWPFFMNNSITTRMQLGFSISKGLLISQAIREAINTARENKDNASLLFSLAWLHQFAKKASVRENKKISLSREESLQYLKMKSKEANLPSLVGGVNLLEAQQLVRNVWSPISLY
jgi:Anaphase-promoting complex subunit 5